MRILKKAVPSLMFLAALALGGLGIALHAADSGAKKPTPREILDPLLEQSQWKPQWVETAQGFHCVFKGPDVWVRLSGDYIVVQSYLGRVAREVAANDLIRVLKKNYDLYEGKFAIDKDMDLWFEINTPKRILDAQELNHQIGYVAAAAAGASSLIKTTTPTVGPPTAAPTH